MGKSVANVGSIDAIRGFGRISISSVDVMSTWSYPKGSQSWKTRSKSELDKSDVAKQADAGLPVQDSEVLACPYFTMSNSSLRRASIGVRF